MTRSNADDSSTERSGDLAGIASLALGVPEPLLHIPIAGAMYLEEMGGPTADLWWPPHTSGDEVSDWLARQHSELSLSVTFALSLSRLFGREPKLTWQLEFDVAYLFFVNSWAQAGAVIQILTNAKCYADAFVVLRSLHGKVNLLALMALGTHLFDEWLKFPKEPRFLDGHVRDELAKHGITTFPHIYEHASEVTHGQFLALSEAGHMEVGLFPRVPAIENRILASTKLLFGIIGAVGVIALGLQPRDKIAQDLGEHEAFFAFMEDSILKPNRFDHLLASIAEERHWIKMSKEKTAIGHWFSTAEFRRQLKLFHRRSQPKSLGKGYRLPPRNGK